MAKKYLGEVTRWDSTGINQTRSQEQFSYKHICKMGQSQKVVKSQSENIFKGKFNEWFIVRSVANLRNY